MNTPTGYTTTPQSQEQLESLEQELQAHSLEQEALSALDALADVRESLSDLPFVIERMQKITKLLEKQLCTNEMPDAEDEAFLAELKAGCSEINTIEDFLNVCQDHS
jgi:hypothetical protein